MEASAVQVEYKYGLSGTIYTQRPVLITDVHTTGSSPQINHKLVTSFAYCVRLATTNYQTLDDP